MLAYNTNSLQVFPLSRYFCVSTVTMKYNKITANERKRIFEAYKKETTGEHWQRRYKSTFVYPKMYPKKKSGSISKKTQEIMAVIAEKIKKEPSCTLSDLCRLVQADFNIKVCINTMKNWLNGELFSQKIVRPCIGNVNRPENKLKRAQYLEAIFQARAYGRALIWVDETNYNLYCRRKQSKYWVTIIGVTFQQ